RCPGQLTCAWIGWRPSTRRGAGSTIDRRMPPDVKQALESGKLFIAYQPLVDLVTHRTFAFEALVRSEDPELPDALAVIRAAVEARFMGVLGRALRRKAIEGCPSYPLFLNVHPDEFDEGWLVRP